MFGSPTSPPDTPEKEPGEYRVFVVGGSTVATGQKESIPSYLQKKFNTSMPKRGVRVYNLGVISQKSSQEIVRLITDQVQFHPDLVVFYDGGNDIMDPYFADPRPGYPMNFFIYERHPFFYRDISDYPVFTLTLFGSKLLRILFPGFFLNKLYQLDELRDHNEYRGERWRKRIAEIYVENLEKGERLSKAFGFSFASFFQPVVYFKKTLHPDERAIDGGSHDPRTAKFHALETRKEILKLVESRRKKGLLSGFHDLSGIYDTDQRSVFYDYIHTHDEPKIKVVDAIYEALARDILK